MAAEEAAAPVPPASPFAQVLENIRNLSQRQKLAAGCAGVRHCADRRRVVEPPAGLRRPVLQPRREGWRRRRCQPQQQNIPYKFSDNGNAILVPATQVLTCACAWPPGIPRAAWWASS
jgi:hypothetical protein